MPTRRAARALAHAFAEALQPRAVLLPRIIPLGDPSDLEERSILTGEGLSGGHAIAPAIGDLERRLLLTSLVEAWRKSRDLSALETSGDGFSMGGGFADSFALAGDLADLIDEFAVEGIDWHRVANLTEGRFDTYWDMTRSFLDIAGTAWPHVLQERGGLDPADRLNRLLRAEAERLKHQAPTSPVIAAGSTGTVPATADLLAAIARLPNGVVVLPGLDTELDEAAWDRVAEQSGEQPEAQPGHPQAALKRLLSRLSIERHDVAELGKPDAALSARQAIVQASARPATATDDWPEMRQALMPHFPEALAGVTVIEASDERAEALAIAVALRQILESPEKTAALVTPDRALAERVAMELRRWGIIADDSSGTKLAATPLGAFARLVLAMIMHDLAPPAIMGVLSHPCLTANLEPAERDTAVQCLEIIGLRGTDPPTDLAGLAMLLDGAEARIADRRSAPALRRMDPTRLDKPRALLATLVTAMQPLAELVHGNHPLSTLVRAHMMAVEVLAGDRATTGADAVGLAKAFDTLSSVTSDPLLALADYAALFDMLLTEHVVDPAQPVQGRIKIWGLLEARLMQADRIVLGGLNEGTWPPQVRSDAFLNRAMRAELGLASPERRIGQSAHDFTQAMGAPDVVIARALSVEGTPMVASRFLRRLNAFVGAEAACAMRSRGNCLLQAAAGLDRSEAAVMMSRPNPKPRAEIQPLSLSVTEIATLLRDPYAIYARHILGLSPLEPLQASIDASDRGSIIHDIMASFIRETTQAWPDDPHARLMALGREGFKPYDHVETVQAFWWPVFEQVADWFVAWESKRRTQLVDSRVEINGMMTISLTDGVSFRLRARADRIDRLSDGSLAIVDYKTGALPSEKQVQIMLEPQLTLMAAMAAAGSFETIPAAPVNQIAYVKLGSASKETLIAAGSTDASIEAMAQRHITGLREMLDRLRDGSEGYLSRRMPERVRDGGPYDHLARTRQWLSEEED